MKFDPEVANSNGFFKDPKTRLPLTGNEKRIIQCSIDDSGKLIWPQVQFSDGSVGKIVYKLWTAEEKAIYKQYRSNSKQRITPVQEEEKEIQGTHPQVEAANVSMPVLGSAPAGSTLAWIRNCDRVYGVWLFEGVVYDLLGMKGYSGYQPIARSLIPREDRERLNIPLGGI